MVRIQTKYAIDDDLLYEYHKILYQNVLAHPFLLKIFFSLDLYIYKNYKNLIFLMSK